MTIVMMMIQLIAYNFNDLWDENRIWKIQFCQLWKLLECM